jgi:hypothetical protein
MGMTRNEMRYCADLKKFNDIVIGKKKYLQSSLVSEAEQMAKTRDGRGEGLMPLNSTQVN